ncbi:aldehyde dehydrogenase family protein [Dactylosporangium sp. NPDC050688]|uniref:aldehyde dehydrogenase family protein n=1 Tax=Dactylosporangium sp. NPDC050688 TaxID=3157217 RepID=UPI0033CD50FE
MHDRFVAALAEAADALRAGDPLDPHSQMGPVAGPEQLAQNLGYVTAGVAGGATVTAGGTHDGQFMRPTLLAGVRNACGWPGRRSSAPCPA